MIYPTIIKDFPDARNIVILRNPLAIANSMMHSEMKAFELFDIAKSIDEIRKYYKTLEKICKDGQVHILTYEQLLGNTELIFSKVLDYLDLAKDRMNEIIIENTLNTKVLVKGAFRSGKADSFLTELTPQQIIKINANLSKEIAFYNTQYEHIKYTCSQ